MAVFHRRRLLNLGENTICAGLTIDRRWGERGEAVVDAGGETPVADGAVGAPRAKAAVVCERRANHDVVVTAQLAYLLPRGDVPHGQRAAAAFLPGGDEERAIRR